MIGLLVVLLAMPEDETALKQADHLAAQARETKGEGRAVLVEKALAAYAALIDAHPKDRKRVPLLRRRRASLLKREGRSKEALAEHDLILAGRSRRKDRARALYDGALLIGPEAALRRLRRVREEFSDIIHVRAKASLQCGRLLERRKKPREARQAYRDVIDRCRDEAKLVIEAYDRMALLAISEKQPRVAWEWLRACVRRYEKRASRGDRYGAFLSRLLGDMRAPHKLAEAMAEASRPKRAGD